LLSVRDFTRC